LRQLIEEGKGIDAISQVMGKTRVSVKAKLYNLGLTLIDPTVVQNLVAVVTAAPFMEPSKCNPNHT
jgi:hypothetical protein